ncbi:MAG: HAD-IA family hydrolase [Candidatus Wildermuthbacteria bacterium]|nr:HAD-IA family hydrolase [Candidatus Wildermuthbacteria bacterium]
MIKVLIFDADGVLINSERFSKRLAREYGISTEKTTPFFAGVFNECLIGSADLKESIAPYLNEWGWEKSVEDFLNYWFSSEHSVDIELVNEIQKYREKGIKCFVATNQEKYRAQYMLGRMGFSESFDRLYASAHLGSKKPSLDFYEKIISELGGIKKEEILFWDDTEENITGAIECGIKAEVYISFNDFKKKMKTHFSF